MRESTKWRVDLRKEGAEILKYVECLRIIQTLKLKQDNNKQNKHMKKLFFLIFTVILFSSCSKSFIQIFDTATTNAKSSEGFWVFETDTIKVTYEFWASKGVMSFSVFNKIDKPIYIDWKNCSFIYNSNKLNYWVDEQQSALLSYYGGYYYNGPLIKPGYSINEGVQASASTTVKPERITFIPPKSFYYRSQFYLMPVDYFKIDRKKAIKSVVARNDKPKKQTTVYEMNFDNSTTPLKFRNYLAFSFTENATNFYFIDNEFYLTSLKEMDYRHYRGKILTSKEVNREYEKPFKKKSSFYIKIAHSNSVKH